jgi:hypothetical protein
MGVCCGIEAAASPPLPATPPRPRAREGEDQFRAVTPFALRDSSDGSGDGRGVASSDTTLVRVAATTATTTTTTTTTSTTHHPQPPSSFPSSTDLNEREDENSNETTVQRRKQMKDLKEAPLSPIPLDRSPMACMNPLALPRRATPPDGNPVRADEAALHAQQSADNARSSDDITAQNSGRRFTGSTNVAIVGQSSLYQEEE